ncbi:hypothetical protein NKH77_03720 [Streptomyces sp. M19]
MRRLPLTALTADPEQAGADPGTSVPLEGAFRVEEFGPVRDVALTASAPEGWSVEGTGGHAPNCPRTGR